VLIALTALAAVGGALLGIGLEDRLGGEERGEEAHRACLSGDGGQAGGGAHVNCSRSFSSGTPAQAPADAGLGKLSLGVVDPDTPFCSPSCAVVRGGPGGCPR
jgi:hypothetical protein